MYIDSKNRIIYAEFVPIDYKVIVTKVNCENIEKEMNKFVEEIYQDEKSC